MSADDIADYEQEGRRVRSELAADVVTNPVLHAVLAADQDADSVQSRLAAPQQTPGNDWIDQPLPLTVGDPAGPDDTRQTPAAAQNGGVDDGTKLTTVLPRPTAPQAPARTQTAGRSAPLPTTGLRRRAPATPEASRRKTTGRSAPPPAPSRVSTPRQVRPAAPADSADARRQPGSVTPAPADTTTGPAKTVPAEQEQQKPARHVDSLGFDPDEPITFDL